MVPEKDEIHKWILQQNCACALLKGRSGNRTSEEDSESIGGGAWGKQKAMAKRFSCIILPINMLFLRKTLPGRYGELVSIIAQLKYDYALPLMLERMERETN